jgi:protein-S-isoprenylcysteine O-methyltransferase Ste14
MQLAVLALLVAAWCALHSGMIAASVTDRLQRRLGSAFRFYRLFYNAVAALTLVPVAMYAAAARTEPLFSWAGYLRAIPVVMLGTAAVFFILGAARYDTARFLGLRQLREGARHKGITESGGLDTAGVLGITRHPWYLATLLLLWARPLDVSALLVNAIFTAYLLIGARLEERKLVREFGGEYRAYQKSVSMLLPVKWVKARISRQDAPPAL